MVLNYGLSAPNLPPHTQLWGAGAGTLQTIFPLSLSDAPGMGTGGRLDAGVERGDLFPVILMSPGCNHMYLLSKRQRGLTQTHREEATQRGGGSEWTDAGTGPGMPSNVTDSGAGRGEEQVLPQSAQREHSPAHYLAFRLWSPELSEYTAIVVSHQVGGN